MNIAVFASGGGSNFQALVEKKRGGALSEVTFAVLVGNNSRAGCFEHARAYDVATEHIAPSHFETEQLYTEKLHGILDHYKIEAIVLAGYMRKIPESVIGRYPEKIINIHPGLLPAFGGQGMYGERVHQAVLAAGVKLSGPTVHFVDAHYDNGPIIAQRAVPVTDDDTPQSLAARVLAQEHDLYWRVLQRLSTGQLRVEGRRVFGF